MSLLYKNYKKHSSLFISIRTAMVLILVFLLVMCGAILSTAYAAIEPIKVSSNICGVDVSPYHVVYARINRNSNKDYLMDRQWIGYSTRQVFVLLWTIKHGDKLDTSAKFFTFNGNKPKISGIVNIKTCKVETEKDFTTRENVYVEQIDFNNDTALTYDASPTPYIPRLSI